jgi:5'-methylthioadenosine phosphorylase
MEKRDRIGVIGGTGLYEMSGLEILTETHLETPFGRPSDAFVVGRLGDRELVFLPRHGRGHRLLPSELNYRANIWGLKSLGVTHILSVSAVGSMKEQYPPSHLVLPDQFYDRTRHRADTFFGDGLVAHVSMADPVCPALAELGGEVLAEADIAHHMGGTYVCMEGPQFSTRAESQIYRSWGADVIGMTQLQEAKLAREAEICFLCLALVTDYDCWKLDEEAVSVEAVLEILHGNAAKAEAVLRALVPRIPMQAESSSCGCRDSLASALVTDFSLVPEETLDALEPLIGRYRR